VEEGFRPFYCGTMFSDWLAANCERCTKGADPNNPPSPLPCDIDQALLMAYFGDGRVSLPIAERMGAVEAVAEGRYNWQCKEWEPTGEWKAEYRRRFPERSPR
jgi:hypothetical protein